MQSGYGPFPSPNGCGNPLRPTDMANGFVKKDLENSTQPDKT